MTHNQINHIFIDNILDLRSFRGAYCDTDHCLVVVNVRERSAVRKQAVQKFDGERFNFRKLNELDIKKRYQIEITNSLAALENLSYGKDINGLGRSLKSITKP